MNELKCEFSMCDRNATVYITQVENRRPVKVLSFCNCHARTHLRDEHEWYFSGSRVDPGRPLHIGTGVEFNIDFTYWAASQGPAWPWGRHYVGLIETGGNRHFGYEFGAAEAHALSIELNHTSTPRPVTHHVMAEAIRALGGRLEFVEIDNFVSTKQTYEAKLRIICQMNTAIAVDLRPSDALVLALICEVPIIVSEGVLSELDSIDDSATNGPWL